MKKLGISTIIGLVVVVFAFAFVVFGTFELPTTRSVQHGYRGTAMDLIYHRAQLTSAEATNVPPHVYAAASPTGVKAKTIYKNLKVLGDLDVAEFNRTMASFAEWVAPTQSCAYCHGASGNFASDALYTKRVALRMLQMTRHLNVDWKDHVGKTGVVCYTCHRGQPVPTYIWFNTTEPSDGIGTVSTVADGSALPANPYTPFLEQAKSIRVDSTTALPEGDRHSIIQTEYTFSLMISMAESLGVNCTFCHNTRAISSWEQSTPQRITAWYGIKMVRDLNDKYLASLHGTFPTYRLGPEGDVPKLSCMTCHQGAYKPLLGAKLAEHYPALQSTTDVASASQPAKPAAPAAPASSPAAPAPETPAPTTSAPAPAAPAAPAPETPAPATPAPAPAAPAAPAPETSAPATPAPAPATPAPAPAAPAPAPAAPAAPAPAPAAPTTPAPAPSGK